MSQRALAQTGADADMLREMIGLASRQPMKLVITGMTGAATGERSPE